ncbi:MAG: hypothetical protein DLM58_08195 [Pseudonocardiales bacterium]|nr:MAG: hypothetical protein DLM58_08195 [Pseudonocardiales bacterium]
MSSWVRAGEEFGQPGRVRRLGPAIPAAVIAMALLVGLVVGRFTAPSSTIMRTVPLAPGSTNVESGVPVGYQHTRPGAVDAATAYAVTLNGPIVFDAAAMKAAEDVIATPDYRGPLEEQTAKALQALDSAYGVRSNASMGVTPAVRLVPVAYRLESYNPLEARVSIWAVWLIAEEGILAPQQAWMTTQLALRWLGDWKLSSSGSHPGPVPQPPQEAVDQQSIPLPAPLTGQYQEYHHVSG